MFEGLKTRCSRHTPGTCTTCNGTWAVCCSPSPSLSGTYPAIKNCVCERLYSPQTGGASEERLSSLSSPQHVGHRFVRHLMRMLPCRPALQLMLMLPCRPGVHGWGLPPHRPRDATQILRNGALKAGRSGPSRLSRPWYRSSLYFHLHSIDGRIFVEVVREASHLAPGAIPLALSRPLARAPPVPASRDRDKTLTLPRPYRTPATHKRQENP